MNKMKNNFVGLEGVNDLYIKEIIDKKDFELNSLDYEEALKLDQRNFFSILYFINKK